MLNIINNFPLSKITTLKIGGKAKEYAVAKTEKELFDTIKGAKKAGKDFLVIGDGSNLLVSDKGVGKLVIKNEVSGIHTNTPGSEIYVKSGTPLQELVDFTISHGLSGLQNLTGIPGTVGGAVFGNAGAYGQTISDNILSVVVLSDPEQFGPELTAEGLVEGESKDLVRITLSKEGCGFGYRDSSFKRNGMVVLEIIFQLERGDPKELKKEADEILQKRLLKYRPGILCPGSFFKNLLLENIPKKVFKTIPDVKDYYGKVPAWYFLEQVGAKGDQLGQIQIASYHANLFINLGGGTAKDFYNLAKKYYKKVKEKFGIELEPEVQLINLPPFK